MKVDVEGNVYCTGPGGIWVMNAGRRAHRHHQTRAVNMAWGGDDWTTLYFTGPTTHQSHSSSDPRHSRSARSDLSMKRSTDRILTTHVGSLVPARPRSSKAS